MRCGLAVSATGQTGQSEAIHSPAAWTGMVVRLTIPTVGSIAVSARSRSRAGPGLAHDVEAAGKRRIAGCAFALPCPRAPNRRGQRLLGVDELGLELGERCGK